MSVPTRKTWPWKRRVIYKAEVVRAKGKKTQGQSALRGDQHEAESTVALRGGLSVNEGTSENRDQGTALRDEIGRTSCTQLLGQSVACLDDRGSLRVDAGTHAPAWLAPLLRVHKSPRCESVF